MTITSQSRREAWHSIRGRTGHLHSVILNDLRTNGPATTKQIAERTRVPLLTTRPRCTELGDLGLIEAIDRTADGSVFQAVSEYEAMTNWETARSREEQSAFLL